MKSRRDGYRPVKIIAMRLKMVRLNRKLLIRICMTRKPFTPTRRIRGEPADATQSQWPIMKKKQIIIGEYKTE